MFSIAKYFKEARLPIGGYIQKVIEIKNISRNNPVGVDTISDNGYNKVIDALNFYQNDIDNQPPDLNVLWAILEKYAPYFTTVQYRQLGELAKDYLI